MGRLRVLVVDDRPRWRDLLSEDFRRLEPQTEAGAEDPVECVGTEAEAMTKIVSRAYDLAVVDLSLLGGTEDPREADERGFELLKAIRALPLQRRCAVIVVTGYPTNDRLHRALQEFGVKRVLYKGDYENQDEELLRMARRAILEARARGAAGYRGSRYHLTLSFDARGWTAGELQGPGTMGRDRIDPPVLLDTANLVRRADNVNLLLIRGARDDDWRKEMADLGDTLFKTVASTPRLFEKWAGAKVLASHRQNLWVRFRGPSTGLGVPFDLMRDGASYLCLDHVLTREIARPGLSQRPLPFASFLHELGSQGRSLRVLLVAANSDGKIPGVEREVKLLKDRVARDLSRLGVACEMTVLAGDEATYGRVKEALRDGRYHLFHYAGHGRYDDDLPQASGLVLRHGSSFRALTADNLRFLAGADLRMVYLSCCLGAVSKSSPSADDLCGIYDGLASAGVPTVLGYRWIVPDASTVELATTFYSHLWRTLCPGEATLEARREAAMGPGGRSDQTWAAPVLLMQGS